MRRLLAATVFVAAVIASFETGSAQPSTVQITATTASDLGAWDGYMNQLVQAGRLRARRIDRDPSLPTRTIERWQQLHAGVPIWGVEIVRDADNVAPVSIFGETAGDVRLSSEPGLTVDSAADRLTDAGGAGARLLTPAQLVILPLESGKYLLSYTGVVSNAEGVFRVFIDATSGAEVRRRSEIHRQSTVGTGRGVLGDQKKVSVVVEAGAYFADDRMRPPLLRTFDFRGNLVRAINVLNGAPLSPAERASDTDNEWTDATAVDAHAHIGWTYDYYFKRHGRRGLDGNNREITTLINAVTPQGALTTPLSLWLFVDNAFWCGVCGPGANGVMFFGNGFPNNVFDSTTGQTVAPLAGSLDIAAHELTHGVIDSTSRLLASGESGALNEAFADIMGTSVEFFFQTAGSARGQADYLIGEDSFRALRPGSQDGIRSLANPQMFVSAAGNPVPDHYSRRYTGPLDEGGVHINAGFPGHAFYLAVEGGTNRTSGLTVQGVGGANRDQIEKVFYRAFVFLLPPNATFSMARAATVQAARDLHGANSAPERAVTQAWTAVGVN
jgi:thermolysin